LANGTYLVKVSNDNRNSFVNLVVAR